MLMLPGVGLALDRHGRMGVVGMVAARQPTGMAVPVLVTMTMTMTMTMTGMIRPAGGRLERGHRGRRSGGREVTGRLPFLPNAAVHTRDSPPGFDSRRPPRSSPPTNPVYAIQMY